MLRLRYSVCTMKYLEGLNERQRMAVLATDGPVSVLAGAGSGKTRVLTTHIYHLIRTGVPVENILAVTFTNKAAREMREHLRARLGEAAPMPLVATFHGLGRVLLEEYGSVLGVPRYFSIFDRSDSERVVKNALKEMDIDPKEVPPRAILARISKAKGEGMTAADFREKHGRESFRARIASEVWPRYDETLAAEKSLDFDDLIALPVRLLEEHSDIRQTVQERFHYVHIDEYQDTNELQGRLANILSKKYGNIFVVGDIDQCLVGGTKVLMEDGSDRAIENLRVGERVLANYGGGTLLPASISRVRSRMHRGKLIRLTTERGKVLVSTPDHIHFAGYASGKIPPPGILPGGGIERTIVLTLCASRRGTTTTHRICVRGNDRAGARALRSAGFSVRPIKKGAPGWRFETTAKEYGTLLKYARRIQDIFPEAMLTRRARLGAPAAGRNKSLSFLPAAAIARGMVVFDRNGKQDLVKQVERVSGTRRVYDIDVAQVHNFIANGITTHNCIYTWRGATIDNLLSFEHAYPNAKTIVLEQNYRSSGTIVAAANAIIEQNKNRKEKRSVTNNPSGELITQFVAGSAEQEAWWITKEIKCEMARGLSPEHFAILFRTNFQSRALEEALLHGSVPYRLLGTRFYDRKEVKDVLSWIRLALEPSRESDRMRAVQAPTRGIGKVTLGKLASGQRGALRAGELVKVETFEAAVAKLSEAAEHAVPSAFVRMVIETSGLEGALAKDGEEGRERLGNIHELATLATRYDATAGRAGIAALLADAALASDQDELDRDTNKQGVTLMTVHAAKGLEFDTVFVTGMEEGLFPHEGMGNNEDRDEEEERRLFYVAITRAKRRLVLTLARVRRIYGVDHFQEPSSFLQDIDMKHLTYADADDESSVYL